MRGRVRAARRFNPPGAVHQTLRPHQVGPLVYAESAVAVGVGGVEFLTQRRAAELLGVVPRAHLVRDGVERHRGGG